MQRRTPLKQKTPLRSNTALKASRRLKIARSATLGRSPSPSAVAKENIQGLLREIVILRDGGCIFRDITSYKVHTIQSADGMVRPGGTTYPHPTIPLCNGYAKDGHLILQYDHLVTRANSATYADSRLGVCVCKGHHGWKSLGGNARKAQYDEIVKTLISPERVKLWEQAESDRFKPTRKTTTDWRIEEAALKQELRKLKTL